MRWLALLVVVAACDKGVPPRQAQCSKVEKLFGDMPRRYYDYVTDDELAKLGPLDAELEDAVQKRDASKIRSLCHRHDPVSAREHDCALVRMYVPSTTADGARIFDPSVPQATFEDPAIAAAMKQLGSDKGWTTYTPYAANDIGSAGDRYGTLRTLCSIP